MIELENQVHGSLSVFWNSKFKICFNSMALNGGDVKTFTVNFLEKVKGLVEDERGSKIVKVYFKDRISWQASCNDPHVFLVKLRDTV